MTVGKRKNCRVGLKRENLGKEMQLLPAPHALHVHTT